MSPELVNEAIAGLNRARKNRAASPTGKAPTAAKPAKAKVTGSAGSTATGDAPKRTAKKTAAAKIDPAGPGTALEQAGDLASNAGADPTTASEPKAPAPVAQFPDTTGVTVPEGQRLVEPHFVRSSKKQVTCTGTGVVLEPGASYYWWPDKRVDGGFFYSQEPPTVEQLLQPKAERQAPVRTPKAARTLETLVVELRGQLLDYGATGGEPQVGAQLGTLGITQRLAGQLEVAVKATGLTKSDFRRIALQRLCDEVIGLSNAQGDATAH